MLDNKGTSIRNLYAIEAQFHVICIDGGPIDTLMENDLGQFHKFPRWMHIKWSSSLPPFKDHYADDDDDDRMDRYKFFTTISIHFNIFGVGSSERERNE